MYLNYKFICYGQHGQTECEKYLKIFSEILSVPKSTVMDLNNVTRAPGVRILKLRVAIQSNLA